MIIEELIAILGYDVRGEGELNRFNKGLEKASLLANRLATAMVAAGTLAAGALAGLGKAVIATSAKFEGYQTSLETIEGSAEKAKAAMAWVSNFAAKTPYELDGVTEAFIKLRAYGFDPMDGTLKTLGDTASAMNKPLMQAVEAFADAATFEFERLKEFGIKSSQKGDQVTFRWQQNGKEMTKTVKKNGKEVTKFLLDTFGNRFNNAMERQSKTWNGMMSNLGDSWDDFKRRIGDAGFFDAAKRRLKGVLDYVDRLDKDGSLDRWAKRLSSMMSSGFEVIAKVIERIVLNAGTVIGIIDRIGEKIGDLLRWISGGKIDLDSWQALIVMFGVLLAVLKPVWVVFAALALAVDDFLTYLRGGESVIGDIIAKFSELVPAVEKVIADFTSMISSMDWGDLGRKIGSSIDFAAIGAAWVSALKAQMDLIKGIMDGVVQALVSLDWPAIGSAWAAAMTAQMSFVKGVLDGIAQSAGEAIKGWFDGLDWSAVGAKIRDGIVAALAAIPAAIIAMLTGGDYAEIGRKVGEGILAGLQSMGGAIKDWFAGLLPGWASDFFTWKTEKDGSLKKKAQEVEKYRRRFEKDAPTKPYNANTPGILQTLENLRGNSARASSGSATVNNSISTVVNLKVEQITNAANNAATAVRDKVSSALSKVPSHPTRTTPSPTF